MNWMLCEDLVVKAGDVIGRKGIDPSIINSISMDKFTAGKQNGFVVDGFAGNTFDNVIRYFPKIKCYLYRDFDKAREDFRAQWGKARKVKSLPPSLIICLVVRLHNREASNNRSVSVELDKTCIRY